MQTHRLTSRAIFAIFIVSLFATSLAAAATAVQADPVQNPRVVSSIAASDGRIEIYRTDTAHLYYLVPETWRVDPTRVSLSRIDGSSDLALAFVAKADYSWTEGAQAEIRNTDPEAIFVDVPRQYVSTQMTVPADLGMPESALLPSDQFSAGDIMFFSLRLTQAQLSTLSLLAKNGSYLTGGVTYAFPYETTSFTTQATIVLDFSQDQLTLENFVSGSALYLRCTATSWDGLDPRAEFTDTESPQQKALIVHVTEAWMTEGGDACSLTSTSARGSWSNTVNYTLPSGIRSGVTSTIARSSTASQFQVVYPSVGWYQFTVSKVDGTMSLRPIATNIAPINDRSAYQIQNATTGKCANVSSNGSLALGKNDGDPIAQWDCSSVIGQWSNNFWQLNVAPSGVSHLRSLWTGTKCLTTGAGSGKGAIQSACDTPNADLDLIVEAQPNGSGFRIRSGAEGLCLGTATQAANNGDALVFHPCVLGAAYETFSFLPITVVALDNGVFSDYITGLRFPVCDGSTTNISNGWGWLPAASQSCITSDEAWRRGA